MLRPVLAFASRRAERAARRGAPTLLLALGLALSVSAGDDTEAETGRMQAIAVPASASARVAWHEERSAFAARLVSGYDLAAPVAEEFAGWILEAATRQQLAPELLASLVMAESSFRKHAVSPLGPVGPAQVHADLWDSFCGGNLLDAEQNLYCGAQILAHLQSVCAPESADASAMTCALRSYNVGYGNRNRPYFVDAGNRYVDKINRYVAQLNGAPIDGA